MPDSKIAWDLSAIATSIGLTDVVVTVHRRDVRLRGWVPTNAARRQIVEIARSTAGVRRVSDELQVR